MTNSHTKWRRDLSQQITYQICPSELSSMIVSGSTARGICDEFSDLEIGLFWHAVPDATDRRLPNSFYNSVLLYSSTNFDNGPNPTVDVYDLNDGEGNHLKVDIIHWLCDDTYRLVNDVCNDIDTSDFKLELLSAISDCLVLKGGDFISDLQEIMCPYPRELKLSIIRENLRFNPHFGPEMLSSRHEMFIETSIIMNSYISRIFQILLALNDVYSTGDLKWTKHSLSRLRILPDDMYRRIQKTVATGYRFDWTEFASILLELKSILNAHAPEIDTIPIDRWFKARRQAVSHFTLR